jgi:protein-L-isoaspartate(D-aspartate) O-methyltransferase
VAHRDADMLLDRARAHLTRVGYDRVKVVLADAEEGVRDGAPYDRMTRHCCHSGHPPSWISDLSEQRGPVVPLTVCGLTRWIAFYGIEAITGTDILLPCNHPEIGWFLASQFVPELRDYVVVNLDDLAPSA